MLIVTFMRRDVIADGLNCAVLR